MSAPWSTIVISEDVYRWLLTLDILQNRGIQFVYFLIGQCNQKAQVFIPFEDGLKFQNGYNIAQIIKIILLKNGQSASDNLKKVYNQNSKQTKTTNWNFIWLSFDDLRMQFDNRIKQLILNGQNALISQVIKQLYEKDDNKNQQAMKRISITQRPAQKKPTKKQQMNSSKKDAKNPQSGQNQNGVLDIKKINLNKNPDQTQSSLQFLILLLTQSLQMSIEEVLGLFTNQNKYLAHLIVKGVNDKFQGVVLFYSLLNKYHKKLKSFVESDPKDAHSCLYAVKPGLISKDQKVAELTIQLFLKMGNIYQWFVSQQGKGSNTFFLGIKRHPHFLDIYFDLLMTIILNQEADFFTNHFKSSFRDSYQMIQACFFIIPSLANSFFNPKLFQLGIIDQWIQIGLKLFQQNLDGKIMSYKFMGQVMHYLPQALRSNQDEYLSIFKNGWKQRKMVEFVQLVDEIFLIFQKLAAEKNQMAKRLYQMIIQIIDIVYDQYDKREYLLIQFINILPAFPSIPIHFFVEVFKQSKLKNYQITLINQAVSISSDPNCLMKIGQACLKYFMQDSLIHYYFSSVLYKICQKTIESPEGKQLIIKTIKGCLQVYANAEITKKNPKIIKQQPMYGIQKGNTQKVNEQKSNQFVLKQKMQSNWIGLVDKLSQLIITETVNEDLQKIAKAELLESNSFIKKNHYKVGSKDISAVLSKRFGVNKQEEIDHDQDYNNRKSLEMLDESNIGKKKSSVNNIGTMSRYNAGGPPTLRKQFAEVVQKKKREQEQRKFQQEKKSRQQAYKKTLVKKQLQKINLLRGFAQQAQIKQDGFWQKFKKDPNSQLQLYPTQLMQPKDIQVIQNIFKKYHRLLRYLFLKYTSSMYSTRQSQNFNQSQKRKQTISVVQLIKFMKEYKLYFLTNNIEIQNLVRDINVRQLNKRQTNQQLDYSGFEQFIIQFCVLIFTKPHTITAKSAKGQENIKKKIGHLSHSQIIVEWFDYLRTVFIQKGQKTAIFDQPQAAYFNQSQVIREFNKRLQQDPDFILPSGYKKVVDKVLVPEAKITNNISKLNQSYINVVELLDEILFQQMGIHIIEPILKRDTKVRVKPHAFVNVKAKIMQAGSDTKPRALSSIIQKKTPSIPPVKMLQKKTLSFGMKMGLSYIGYKDKLLGQQVAYVIDDMLDAIQKGRNTIQKQKIVNQVVRTRLQKQENLKKQQQDRKRKLKQRKQELQKLKKENEEKKQKQKQQNKQEVQKQKKKKQDKEKRLKQKQEKYLQEQKQKLKQKKEKQEEQKKKKQQEEKKKKQLSKTKEKFQQFNNKQIEKFKTKTTTEKQKLKKEEQQSKQQQKKKTELYKKLRQKISQKDKKAIEIKQQTHQAILQLFNSPSIKQVFTEFQPATRSLFDFLMQNTYVSLTQKKLKNQIILQTWHYFNLVFQLSPLIISSKEVFSIFRTLTKQKQISADYHTGLSYEDFKQALLRIAIRHKSVFNKIADKIKQDDMTDKQINEVINKDIQQKEKNEFDQPNEIDVKGLLKQQDIKKEYWNHYGDISKVNDRTLKGLIYYLKVPRDKQGQQQRWRQIVASKVKYNAKQTQKLKQKLNEQYSLKKQQRERQKQRIRKRLAASQHMNNSTLNNSMMNNSMIKESKIDSSMIDAKEEAENQEP